MERWGSDDWLGGEGGVSEDEEDRGSYSEKEKKIRTTAISNNAGSNVGVIQRV